MIEEGTSAHEGLGDQPGSEAETGTIEVELHDTATDGRGVGRLPTGKVVFVEGGLTGEVVGVQLERETRKLASRRCSSARKCARSRPAHRQPTVEAVSCSM